jgi:hypothetical protein
MTEDDAEARKRRAEQLKKRIAELTATDPPAGPSAQRPDESDGEYVQRRMRELDRDSAKPQKPQ